MTADSKRRSFPEFAKLLSKEPGWADEESALQEILGAFLRGQLSDVTCPRADVGVGEHGVLQTRVAIPGPDPNPAVLPDPMYIPDRLIEIETPLRHKRVPTLSPPQQPFTRDDWKEGFRAFGGQGQNAEVIGFEVLADIPISDFPPEFRQAYIDWLYTTDAAIACWLTQEGRPVPSWLQATVEPTPTTEKQPQGLGQEHQRKGGLTPKYHPGAQEFVNRLYDQFEADGPCLTLGTLESWLLKNAPEGKGHESEISDFDDVEYYDGILWWKDGDGAPHSFKIRTFERYIVRAKARAADRAV